MGGHGRKRLRMDGGDSDSDSEKNGAAAGGCSGAQLAIFIRSSDGSKFMVEACLGITVGSFKSLLAQQCDIPPEQQRLIYNGRFMKDEQTLESYGLAADHTIHLVRSCAPVACTNTTAGGLNLNRPGLFGADFDRFQQHMMISQNPNITMMMSQNPNMMMRDRLNMPLCQNIMNNPEIICNSILNNDPATLRQTFEGSGRDQLNNNPPTTASQTTPTSPLPNPWRPAAWRGFGVPNRPNVPPEELYATQLTQLQEMGFFDTQENIRALIATAGNVRAAMERLLGNPPGQ